MLTMRPQAGEVIELLDSSGQGLGNITVEEIRDELVLGRFFPGREFAGIRHLFLEHEKYVNEQVFSIVDELEGDIADLELQIGSGGNREGIHDVQIMNQTDISFRMIE